MDVTPTTSSPKTPRTKIVKEPGTVKPARKTLTTSRKKSKAVPPLATEAMPVPHADLRNLIETTAFYLAAERSFAPGHELDDWLEAERRITAQYAR